MIERRAVLVERLRQRLRASANDAGWGYYPGKVSRLEPSGWALLALGSAWAGSAAEWPDFASRHLRYLGDSQGTDGLLVDTEATLANASVNGLAAIVMTPFAPLLDRQALSRLYEGLAGVKGVRINVKDPKQDNQLQGWPWIRETFSWVEPTSWCLLALKRADVAFRNKATAAREREAEKLLVDRVCVTGGWNYGNASALGQDLRAYVPTTAIALLAMQNLRAEPSVQRSVRFLMDERLNEPSAMALSLTTMCLRVYGLPADDVEDRLERAVVRTEQSANVQVLAMALYALSAELHNLEALRVRA
jgi:hypothetical protein